MEISDEKTAEDFLIGDESAFNRLVGRYARPIFSFIFRFVKDRQTAEDLTQETFVKTWKNLRRFDRNRKFKTWIFSIAKNTALDYLKKKKTVPFSFFEDESGNNFLENASESVLWPEEIREKNNLAEELEAMLEKIPENYRMILIWRYKDEFSLAEIAEILDRPYNTIKSYHQRALTSLKKAFWEKSASKSKNKSYKKT